MKKTIFNIFLAVVATVCLAACSTREQDIRIPAASSFPEDATLTLGFYAPSGVGTRAEATDMETEPFVESMHVLVFDGDGTLLTVREATLSAVVRENYDPEDLNPNTMLSYWTIDKVDMTTEPRVLHFVANLPDENVPKTGSESSVFRTLSVGYPRASYWQRIVLEDGIQPYAYDGTSKYSYIDGTGVIHENVSVPGTYDSSNHCYTDNNGATVNTGDYIDVNGNKIVNGTGYYYIPAAGSPLREQIPLIRNFVKIHFVNSWTSFDLKKIALVNTPKAGLVAPFRTQSVSTDPRFETAYQWSGDWTPGYVPTKEDVSANGYAPLLSSAGLEETPIPAGMLFVPGVEQDATLFMYERGLPSEGTATSILFGGEVTVASGETAPPTDGEGLTWFRMEITDADGEYFPFYRNFTYTLYLTGIENPAVHGHRTAQEALDHVALGNISNAKETETLTQINDGKGLTLWVDYVDYTTVGGGERVPLLYTLFYEDPSSHTKTYFCDGASDRVTFTRKKSESASNLSWATTNDFTKAGKITENDVLTGQFWDKRPSPDYDWYVVMVDINSSTTDILRNDVEVQGRTLSGDAGGASRLSRLVTYTVTHQQKLTLSMTPIGRNEADRPTHLTVTLPNTLTRSAFPLSLRIEAEDNNITPTGAVVARTGPSTFDESTKNSYYFVKTIEYSEYAALDTKAFTFDFVTTKATSRTDGKVTRVKVTEEDSNWFSSADEDATCDLICNENVHVTGITLDKDEVWMEPGNQTVQLSAHVDPWDASNLAFSWSIDDPDIATVSANGLVTSQNGIGTATVTVTSEEGGYTDQCVIHVCIPVTGITLNESVLNMPLGTDATLTATVAPSNATFKNVVWSSSNPTVASVSDAGVVTALAPGMADITATATDGSGVSATCTVDVIIPVTGIELNMTEMTLDQHDTELLRATISPTDASNKAVAWESSNPAVATVNEYGVVTAVASSGTATITARSVQNSSIAATCVVTAAPKMVTAISLNKTSTTLDRWASETLTATVTPHNATDGGIVWSSDDTSVATVDQNGLVTAVCDQEGSHTTTIRATAHDGSGVVATCSVTVNYTAVTGVTLNKSSQMLPFGNMFDLTATITPSDATKKTVTWSSSNNEIATVASNGEVTGVSVGTATITVTTDDGGYTATCEVEVYQPVTGVSIDQTGTQTVYLYCDQPLTATVSPPGATIESINWSVADPSIASYNSETNRIKGLSVGSTTVTVTVTDVNGVVKKDTRNVTVTNVVSFDTKGTDYTAGPHVQGAVSLTFGSIRTRNANYVELNNNSGFTLEGVSGTGAKIKGISINYRDNDHACTNGSTVSVPGTGTVYASSGTTATWTANESSNAVSVTLVAKTVWLVVSITYYPQITSMTVTYE